MLLCALICLSAVFFEVAQASIPTSYTLWRSFIKWSLQLSVLSRQVSVAAQSVERPLFLPMLASNGTPYANVTGGQRIEVISSGRNVVLQSGFKRNLTLTSTICVIIPISGLQQSLSYYSCLIGVGHIVGRRRFKWNNCWRRPSYFTRRPNRDNATNGALL
jgi:hypothetical protein